MGILSKIVSKKMGFYHHKYTWGCRPKDHYMGFSPPEVGNTSDIPSEKKTSKIQKRMGDDVHF